MKTATTGDDGDLHHLGVRILFPYAFPLDQEEEGEAAAVGGGGGGAGAVDMMQIDEDAGWLVDLLVGLPLDPRGDDDATSTITAETCITGDEMMLPTEGADWDRWLLQDQDLAADPRGDDDATTTSTAAEMWADGGRWEMQVDNGDDGEWVLRFDDWVSHPHGDDAATVTTAESRVTTAESRVTGDDHWQPGAGDCGAAGDLPLDWWAPEPTGPPDQLAQGGGVLPDLEAALSLDLSWGTYRF